MRVMRLWRTLRRLRAEQIRSRLWFRIYRPRPDLRAAPQVRRAATTWRPCARTVSMTGPSRFTFLGVERMPDSPGDWNRNDWPKLWLYNLHYFDDLIATCASDRREWHRALIRRWVAENPPGAGNGWEPYPCSLRIVNWIKWALAGNTLDKEANASLAVQCRWLRKRLEIHLLGNHLWANAKALIFAGLYFEGEEADLWRTKGLSLLRRELGEQILGDGGHFERSPMYHAIVLEDLLDLIQLATICAQTIPGRDLERWRETVTQMLHWLKVMSHPDGGIAFFNDAAFDIAPSLADLIAYAYTVNLDVAEESLNSIEALPESGYARLQVGTAVLIADIGEIGPTYQPGHAHADTLSFELSVHGERVLVNAGTSTYELGEERRRQRGTSAHNTVEVNGMDSSEVWAGFRVARRARPLDVEWGEEAGELWLRAAHDGYTRLRGIGKVERAWRLSANHLVVEDRVHGKPRIATAYFRCHPALTLDRQGRKRGLLRSGHFGLNWEGSDANQVRIAQGCWHPRFGENESCQVLEMDMTAGRLHTSFTWA